ncbi:MAG: hypothetical protein WBX18_19755, partial [Terracidiphilus sp.]
EYHDGPKAGENFEKPARAVFQAPRVAIPKKQPKAKPKRRKTTGSDKGWNGSSCPCGIPVQHIHFFRAPSLIHYTLPTLRKDGRAAL